MNAVLDHRPIEFKSQSWRKSGYVFVSLVSRTRIILKVLKVSWNSNTLELFNALI